MPHAPLLPSLGVQLGEVTTPGITNPMYDIPGCVESQVFSNHRPADQIELGAVCGVDLGPAPASIAKWLPAGQLKRRLTAWEWRLLEEEPPAIDRQGALEILVPAFTSKIALSGLSKTEALSLVTVNEESRGEGLFFNSVIGGAIGLAVQSVYANAHFLDDCGVDGEFSDSCGSVFSAKRLSLAFQQKIKPGGVFDSARFEVFVFSHTGCGMKHRGDGLANNKADLAWPEIEVGADGSRFQIKVTRTFLKSTAWNPGHTAYLCVGYSTECFLADYYMWWAWRLLDLVYRLGPTRTAMESMSDFTLAVACARAAIAEISSLGGILVHEWTHLTASWLECKGERCCHNFVNAYFVARMTAEYGLPLSHTPGNFAVDRAWTPGPNTRDDLVFWGSVAGPTGSRFDIPAGGWVVEVGHQNCSTSAKSFGLSPSGMTVNWYLRAIHCDLWEAPHSVKLYYGYSSRCDPFLSYSSGTFVEGYQVFSGGDCQFVDSPEAPRGEIPNLYGGADPDTLTGCQQLCSLHPTPATVAECLQNCEESWHPDTDEKGIEHQEPDL